MAGLSIRKELLTIVGIFVLALSARLIYLHESSVNPSFTAPTVDSGTYHRIATALAERGVMNDEFFWQPFFYPVFLSVVYWACNSSIICAKVMQVLLGCITCLLTYQLAKKSFGWGLALLAGAVTALYGPLIFFETELLATGWAASWSLILLLLFLKASSGKSILLCVVLGICGALSILTRPTFIPFFTAAVVWLTVAFRRYELRWGGLALRLAGILTGFMVVAVPVATLNFRITGRFGILPATGGINLYIGNNADYSKTVTARPGWGWEELTRLPERDGVRGGIWEQQKYFNRKVTDFVLNEPLAFIEGLGHKSVQFLSSRELPRNVSIYVFRKWSCLLGFLTWEARGFGFPFGVLLPLALLGLVSHWRQTSTPIKLFLILYPLSIILVFTAARYRAPIVPVMSIPASAGLISLVRTIRQFDWRRMVILGVCGVVVFWVSTVPGPYPEELPDYEAELYANSAAVEADRGNNDIAFEYFHKALSLQSDYPSAHANLAVALAQAGKPAEAIAHYETALQFKDDSPEVHNNLASALADLGKREQALTHYLRAIELRPGYAEAHFNLGNLYLAVGETDKAIEHLERAVRIKEDYFKGYNSLGAAFATKGDYEQAVVHFSNALRLRAAEYTVHRNLATALRDWGKSEEAVKEYREALRLNPGAAEVLAELAHILAFSKNEQVRDVNEAIDLARRAWGLTGYADRSKTDTLAKVYAEAGRFAEAAAVAQRAYELAYIAGNSELAEYFRKQALHYESKAEEKQQNTLRGEGHK
jgi:tetratricopeptide (TPR) repeat protein